MMRLGLTVNAGLPTDIAVGRALVQAGQGLGVDYLAVQAGGAACGATFTEGCVIGAIAIYGAVQVYADYKLDKVNEVAVYPLFDTFFDFIGDRVGID